MSESRAHGVPPVSSLNTLVQASGSSAGEVTRRCRSWSTSLCPPRSCPQTTGGSDWTAVWLGLGLGLGAIGLGIRGFSLGYVASGTSGRATVGMRADTLNTTEAYSLVRHPLYLGNLLLWLGAAAFVGRPLVIVLTGLLFWVYYERIMIAEESYLSERFGERFADWAANTPALFPGARSAWQRSDSEFSFRHTVGRDYPAVYGFVATTFVIQGCTGVGTRKPNGSLTDLVGVLSHSGPASTFLSTS